MMVNIGLFFKFILFCGNFNSMNLLIINNNNKIVANYFHKLNCYFETNAEWLDPYLPLKQNKQNLFSFVESSNNEDIENLNRKYF